MTDENANDQESNHVNHNENNCNVDNNHDIENGQKSISLRRHIKMMLEISPNSVIEHNIHNVLRKHFLEQRSIMYKPIKIELIVNTQLMEDFFVIKKQFEKASDENRAEFEEHYGFLIDNDTQIYDICNNGYHCMETTFNVLGHSKYGVYICKYADVCIRQANVRRACEGNVMNKMIIFKFVQGKQTAALVRKGHKLQPIAPTPQFTSHCSVITPKETDDLEKQFDQSQIFLYEFDGREAVKRPRHCLPYAIVSLVQDGSQWPINFEDLDIDSNLLETNILRVIADSDDPLLKTKLKENDELAEVVMHAVENACEDERSEYILPIQQNSLSSSITEVIQTITTSENDIAPIVNGTEISSFHPSSNDNLPTSLSSPAAAAAAMINNSTDSSTNSTILPTLPPPLVPSSSTMIPSTTVSSNKAITSLTANATPLAHSAAIQAAYRAPAGLLGVLPTVPSLRAASGTVYATTPTIANGLTGQILYGGVSLDALRSYSATGTTTASPYIFATHANQTMQQPALYAAQLQAVVQQQQQAAQLAATAAQQQHQQQQNLINGVPAGCMLVRAANGTYALLAQPSATSTTNMQPQPQATVAQQQFISLNASGQPIATGARLPTAALGAQSPQIVYQYAGQPSLQAGATQYIQLPANFVPQQQISGTSIIQAANSTATQSYTNQSSSQYITAQQSANSGTTGSSMNSAVVQPQVAANLISPQKQTAASATAAALQQQQQYQHNQFTQQAQSQQQQQQQQQASANSAHNTNVYYAAIAQAQAQQQHLNFISQMQYPGHQIAPQSMYYAATGSQNYVLATTTPTSATTTTGAPVVYSAGPALHNGTTQQQSQQQQQQHIAYQIASATGQSSAAAYQILNTSSTQDFAGQQQSVGNAGVVAQQPPQLVQRSNVVPQVRHHPYRN